MSDKKSRNQLLEEILTATQNISTLPDPRLFQGWATYFNGVVTPISLVDGVRTKLTMDTTGGAEDETWLPLTASGLWDSVNSQFDFSSLSVGDMVDIRLDADIDTLSNNVGLRLELDMGIGSPGQFTLPFGGGYRSQAGNVQASRFNGVFIGSADVVNNPAAFYAISEGGNSSGFIIDVYVKVLKGSL